MNTLAILRGTFDNFRPLSLTTTTCVNLYGDLPLISYYFERALSLTCEHYNVNEHPHNPSGYFSVTFDQHRCLLRLALIFIGILRGTFGNFRPLSFTTSACVNLERHLPSLRTYHYFARYRQLGNIVMSMNTLEILRGTFGNFRPLSLTTTTCVNLHRDLSLISYYFERSLSPTCEHYNVNEHPCNPSGYFR